MEEENKLRILVVDDDEDNVRLLKAAFQESGFEVMPAVDGLQGLDFATKHLPDLVITGIIMPRMSGFEMIKNLKANVATADIPVIVYSHLGREEDRVEAQKVGARDFMVRGLVSPHAIIERAKQLISRGKEYYVEFDPQRADAKTISEAFDFPSYFECPDGSRMLLKLEPMTGSGTEKTFRATFVCKSNQPPHTNN